MLESTKQGLTIVFKLALLNLFAGYCVSAHAKTTNHCESTPEVLTHTTLSGLANFWFGSPDFQFAILTATNARSADPMSMFAFISNPHQLSTLKEGKPNHVCIPEVAEAERLKLRFDSYLAAVHDMALAEPSEMVDNLDPVPASGPVTVVSWVRADQAKKSFSGQPGSTYTTKDNMWVTLAPHVQKFCREFAATHSENPDRVTLRLEQRLGLGPASSKTHFIELAIATPRDRKSLFRPCGDTNVMTTSCTLGGPSSCGADDKTCHQQSDFFYQQYYSSYGSARPVEYPWTSLGYTFDWEYKEAGLGGRFDFVQIGESEYVVPAHTKMELVSKQTTAEYCGLVK
ncbi:MAG: hypothetical protein ACI9XU_000148 [Arenicella sp.]|jgi:hypothetical protein